MATGRWPAMQRLQIRTFRRKNGVLMGTITIGSVTCLAGCDMHLRKSESAKRYKRPREKKRQRPWAAELLAIQSTCTYCTRPLVDAVLSPAGHVSCWDCRRRGIGGGDFEVKAIGVDDFGVDNEA